MLDKTFNPTTVEGIISQKWEDKKLFACQPNSNKPPFSVIIPPPNVTGNLHIGHALNNSVQDLLCRFKRMKGFDVLWQPGMDHAGIATQMVVERQLAKSGISRHDLGREKFIEKVWEWKAESGGQIFKQLRRLGASCDWDRERFTMDEGLSRAVLKIFVKMYKDGLIYKDKRLVNWDSKLQTAISDLEVIEKETIGKMWYFKYVVEENPNEFIMIGTTRPETLFGDTAVAVNAEDERYKHLIGKNVLIPIINKPIPVVADIHADPTKGTGAVKITPAHDFNDFEVGKRHNLPMVNILTKEAKLNENVPEKYQGMTPIQARDLVLEDIKALGLYDHEEDNPMVIPYGDRSDVIIEPWLTDQWFVDAPKLAVKAIEAVKEGDMQFVPQNWENTYFEWMNNIQPWCISRQLWWGHQVPVWYGPDGAQFCEETEQEALQAAQNHYGHPTELKRDTDVLDTWFSSGLWAFSTLGWPDDTVELSRYYPTSVLVTAFDIIFFWVARMMMMSMYAMGQVPFRQCYIHGLVRDEQGRKMSKSKGNGIDPLEMCDKYGTDALRFALLIQAGHGRDVLMSDNRVEAYRNFTTKIWNAARFCEMNSCQTDADFDISSVESPISKWILSKLQKVSVSVSDSIDNFSFNEASNTIYHFIWDEFCNTYLELIKPILFDENSSQKSEIQHITAFVFENILKILQPFMPFISEELWSKTKDRANMIMEESWPEFNQFNFEKEESDLDWVLSLTSLIRSTRSDVHIPPASRITLEIKDISADKKDLIADFTTTIKSLCRIEEICFVSETTPESASCVFEGISLSIPLSGLIDLSSEKEKINKEIENLSSFITRNQAMLNNPDFVSKAPEKVVSDKRTAIEKAQTDIEKLKENLLKIGG